MIFMFHFLICKWQWFRLCAALCLGLCGRRWLPAQLQRSFGHGASWGMATFHLSWPRQSTECFVIAPRGLPMGVEPPKTGRASSLMHLSRASAAASLLRTVGVWQVSCQGWAGRLMAEAGHILSKKSSRSLAPCCLFFALVLHIPCTEVDWHFLLGAVVLLVASVRCRHPIQMWFISL